MIGCVSAEHKKTRSEYVYVFVVFVMHVHLNDFTKMEIHLLMFQP